MSTDHRTTSDADLITHLRRAASTWFRNTDLHALEELIRRYHGRQDTSPGQMTRRPLPIHTSSKEP
jgi:hypothetical protein